MVSASIGKSARHSKKVQTAVQELTGVQGTQATAISDFEKELEKLYNDVDCNAKQTQVTGLEVTDGAAGEAKAKKGPDGGKFSHPQ